MGGMATRPLASGQTRRKKPALARRHKRGRQTGYEAAGK